MKANNTWTNEFGDRIIYDGSFLGKKYMEHVYNVSIDGKYVKSVGSVNIGKTFVNTNRNVKCKWVGTTE